MGGGLASRAYDVESAEQIRHYVKRRTGLFWSFAVADFVIGGLALPVLLYLRHRHQQRCRANGDAGGLRRSRVRR